MIKATRWVSADPGEKQRRKYLALYELETDDVKEFDIQVQKRGKRTREEGRFSDLPEFDPPNVPRMYRQILESKEARNPGK